jgi:hypothetical protein
MTPPQGILVYLAGPIANQPLWVAREWRRTLIDGTLCAVQEDVSVAFFDPANAFTLTNSGIHNPALVSRVQLDIDDAALKASDVVVAQMLEGVESAGTDHEVRWAVSFCKSLIVFGSLQYRLESRMSRILRSTGLHTGNLVDQGKLRFVSTLADATSALVAHLHRLEQT